MYGRPGSVLAVLQRKLVNSPATQTGHRAAPGTEFVVLHHTLANTTCPDRAALVHNWSTSPGLVNTPKLVNRSGGIGQHGLVSM